MSTSWSSARFPIGVDRCLRSFTRSDARRSGGRGVGDEVGASRGGCVSAVTYVCRFKMSSMGGNVGIECIEDEDDALYILRMTEPDGSLVMESVTMASEALDYGRGCFESCALALGRVDKIFVYCY